MPRRISYKPSFLRAFERLPREKQIVVLKALDALEHYFQTGQAGYGLRIKKLYGSPSGKTLEARAGLDLRLVWVEESDKAIFWVVGDHDEVQRFLKTL